jgi:hypothetical protein
MSWAQQQGFGASLVQTYPLTDTLRNGHPVPPDALGGRRVSGRVRGHNGAGATAATPLCFFDAACGLRAAAHPQQTIAAPHSARGGGRGQRIGWGICVPMLSERSRFVTSLLYLEELARDGNPFTV